MRCRAGRVVGVAVVLAGFATGMAQAQMAGGAAGTTRWVVAAEGNSARYRVREQLARVNFPSDAVGETTAVRGEIVIAPDGTIESDASRIVIATDSLATDSDRRDNYVRRRTLVTAEYPEVVFVPTAFEGLPWPLPGGGEVSFRLRGDLTVKDRTRPVVWEVTATLDGTTVRGEAKTSFTFADFEMDKPRVGSVLSVEDEIRLEYTFLLSLEGS